MSTKSTIWCSDDDGGPDLHVYTDARDIGTPDAGAIYLDVDGERVRRLPADMLTAIAEHVAPTARTWESKGGPSCPVCRAAWVAGQPQDLEHQGCYLEGAR